VSYTYETKEEYSYKHESRKASFPSGSPLFLPEISNMVSYICCFASAHQIILGSRGNIWREEHSSKATWHRKINFLWYTLVFLAPCLLFPHCLHCPTLFYVQQKYNAASKILERKRWL